MKVLVIGGSGVIGSGIVESAAKAGHDITAVSRQKTIIQKDFPNVRRIRADWSDINSAQAIINEGGGGYEVVVDGRVFTKEQLIRDLEIAGRHCAQFVYISTVGVYEQPFHNATEDAPKRLEKLLWSYSYGKRDAEIYIEQNRDKYPCGITVIRPPLTYGNTRIPIAVAPQRFSHYTLIDRIIKHKPIVFIKDGNNQGCITHISTFADGVAGTFLNRAAIGQAYHICDDVSYTWEDVINTVGEIIGVKPEIVHVPVGILKIYRDGLYDEIRYNKMSEGTLDNSRIKSLCPNVRYSVPLREGLSETVRFQQENFSSRPLDEGFNVMCDAILFRHKEYSLPEREREIAERYISLSSAEYIRMLKRYTQMKKAGMSLRPVLRILRKAAGIFKRRE